MTYRCDHLHLRSRDANAAAAFYAEAFGAREIRRDGSPSSLSRVVVDLGGLNLFIEQAPSGTTPASVPPHLGIEHLGLAVPDLDAALMDLEKRGVKIVSGPTELRPGLRVLFLEGPDAVLIELLERR